MSHVIIMSHVIWNCNSTTVVSMNEAACYRTERNTDCAWQGPHPLPRYKRASGASPPPGSTSLLNAGGIVFRTAKPVRSVNLGAVLAQHDGLLNVAGCSSEHQRRLLELIFSVNSWLGMLKELGHARANVGCIVQRSPPTLIPQCQRLSSLKMVERTSA